MSKTIVAHLNRIMGGKVEVMLYDNNGKNKGMYYQRWDEDVLVKRYFRASDCGYDFSIFAHNQFRGIFYSDFQIVIDYNLTNIRIKIPLNTATMQTDMELYMLKVINEKSYGNKYKTYAYGAKKLKTWYAENNVLFVGKPEPIVLKQ
jgi:hypothetical protein